MLHLFIEKQYLGVALGHEVILAAQIKGHEVALALYPGEIVCPKEAHRHSPPPGDLHVWRYPGVINCQDLLKDPFPHQRSCRASHRYKIR